MLKMTRARFGLALAMPFLLTAALLFLTVHSARSQEADQNFQCIPEAAFTPMIASVRSHPGVRVGTFNAAETKAFLAALNAIEPVSNWTGDSVVFAITPAGAVAYVIMKAGQACMAKESIPAAVFQKLLEATVGAPA